MSTTDSVLEHDEIAEAVVRVLRKPPTEVGMRLRPEGHLAQAYKVTLRQVRSSLAKLVRDGVLVRQRGSGTYVRAIPNKTSSYADRLSADLLSVRPESILAPSRLVAAHAEATSPRKQYHLELWSDLHCTSKVNQEVLAGMVSRADELGHRLTIHTVRKNADQMLSVDELSKYLDRNPGDAYLVISFCADRYVEVFQRQNKPLLYFMAASQPILHEPFVMLHTSEAISRAVARFVSQGYKRIAMVGLGEHEISSNRDEYLRAISVNGLEYSAMTFPHLDYREIVASVLDLVKQSGQPEAVYIQDEYLLEGALEGFRRLGLTPGKDLGVITHNNVGHTLPGGFDWSTLEFDLPGFGRKVIDELLGALKDDSATADVVSVHAKWRPGSTHLIEKHSNV